MCTITFPLIEAQRAVDSLVERRLPAVWTDGDIRRVLKPDLPLKDQILLLMSSTTDVLRTDQLFEWTDYQNRGHFNRILRNLHKARFIELKEKPGLATLLPPGADYVTELTQRLT